MSDAILIAVITAVASIVCQLLINKQNNTKHSIEQAVLDAKLDDRLERIDAKLEEHNGYAKLFSEYSISLTKVQKDIEWIKGEVKK